MQLIKENVHVYADDYDFGVVDVFVTRYFDGNLGLAISEEYGTEVISTNISGYGFYPGKNCVFVKDYSEHKGIVKSLVASGIGEIVRAIPIGYGNGFEFRLFPEFNV